MSVNLRVATVTGQPEVLVAVSARAIVFRLGFRRFERDSGKAENQPARHFTTSCRGRLLPRQSSGAFRDRLPSIGGALILEHRVG